ncbi:restriction endonuclease subunit S [Ligilactobacillus salivarius]|uniref:restriction endonuclease subunit S n=1 Tax=Ligilactobacillus salivarius TaxID=1624 RepID=UPI0039924D8D
MKYYLKDIAKIKNGKKTILEDVGVKVYGSNGVIGFSKDSNAPRNSIIIGRVGANTGSVFFSDEEHWVTDNAISVVPNNKINPIYLFYLLKQKKLNRLAEGSAQPLVNQKILNSFLIDIPSLEIQNKIADKLYKIDKKIEINNKINTNLEKISTEFFLNWLSNTHSDKKKSLDSIANYKNGLAMQKFRPVNIKESLPVVKIRELNQGHTDSNSDLCRKDIDKSVQINTGDIIFSWSGTLLLDLWAGTEAGLNQHLFKVTSNDYPSWFIYEWTKYYLQEFQLIAESKATTMGHIKRSNLKESFAIIPNDNELTKLNNLLGPIFDNKIKIRKQNLILKQIKKQLLAKLLN